MKADELFHPCYTTWCAYKNCRIIYPATHDKRCAVSARRDAAEGVRSALPKCAPSGEGGKICS